MVRSSRVRTAMARGMVVLLAALALNLSPVAPAQAAPPLWSVNTVERILTMPGSGQVAGFEVACASGWTPIAGSYQSFVSSNLQRLSEEVGYGSGALYSVTLKAGPNNVTGDIYVRAYCVPTSYFSNSTVKYGVFTASSGGVASGTVACDPGWYSLSSRVTFSSFSGGPIRTSTPDMEFDAWYAVGTAPAGTTMTVMIRCVPASDMSNARFASSTVTIGSNGASASASCSTGMVPIVGGTWQDSGSGAVTTMARPYQPTRSWVSSTYGGSGTMRTNVVCVPGGSPSVSLNWGVPTPQPNSSGASWTFSATDPSASGGYGISTACSLDGGSYVGCTSPYVATGLSDGTHTVDVRATTSDGRVSQPVRSEVRIDTTAPSWVFTSPQVHAESTPSVKLDVSDADPWVSFQCGIDGASPVNCGGVQVWNDPTTHTLYLPNPFTDGLHTLQVTGTDGRGNSHSEEHTFTVDTVAPEVTQTGPSRAFVLSTSVEASWTATDATTDIASSEVTWRQAPYNGDFGDATVIATSAAARSQSLDSQPRGSTTCLSVRSLDLAANASGWTTERCAAVPLDDRDLAPSAGWRRSSVEDWFRGTALRSETKGARLSVTGATVARVAVSARKCPSCGTIGVYVAGERIAKISLAAQTSKRQLVVLPALPEERTGTVVIKVLSSDRTVQIDALGLSRV